MNITSNMYSHIDYAPKRNYNCMAVSPAFMSDVFIKNGVKYMREPEEVQKLLKNLDKNFEYFGDRFFDPVRIGIQKFLNGDINSSQFAVNFTNDNAIMHGCFRDMEQQQRVEFFNLYKKELTLLNDIGDIFRHGESIDDKKLYDSLIKLIN